MKHCGHVGAVITMRHVVADAKATAIADDGRPQLAVCFACAGTLAARLLREGYCYGSCVDAVGPHPDDPRAIRYLRPWEPCETCLHCGMRRGSCIRHRNPEIVTDAAT